MHIAGNRTLAETDVKPQRATPASSGPLWAAHGNSRCLHLNKAGLPCEARI